MGLIDVTIDRPALRRTEVVDREPETEDVEEVTVDEQSGSGSRIRHVGVVAGGLVALAAGALTLRRLRRRGGDEA